MNLIVNRKLNRNQKEFIHELTLKKRQSKKSTMSEKQLAAKQQLARELILERIIPIEDSLLATRDLDGLSIEEDFNSTATSISNATTQSNLPSESSIDSGLGLGTGCSADTSSNGHYNDNHCDRSINKCSSSRSISTSSTSHESPSATGSSISPNSQQKTSCACSFGRSDSSFSGSSQNSSRSGNSIDINSNGCANSKQLMIDHNEQQLALKKLAAIKFHRTRLQHLNEELERKLYQYEYLVTKEKSLLSNHNMVLFTSEGVNNFYEAN